MTDDEYARELFSAMLEEAQQDLLDGMERAGHRCIKKAELKVYSRLCWILRRVFAERCRWLLCQITLRVD